MSEGWRNSYSHIECDECGKVVCWAADYTADMTILCPKCWKKDINDN